MFFCIHSGCGCPIPNGESSICPNCGKNPFVLDPGETYSPEEYKGRKILLASQK